MFAGLAAYGVFAVAAAHAFGSGRAAAAALMPMLVGGAAIVCGLAGALGGGTSPQSDPLPLRGLTIVALAAVAYAAAFTPVGYLASTLALAAVLTFAFVRERRAAWRALLAQALLIGVLYAVFTNVFFIQLPHGSMFR